MSVRGTALINLDDLSPATRKELEVWGQYLAHLGEDPALAARAAKGGSAVVELERLAAVKAYLIAESDKALKEAVYRARSEKLSWHTIGNALGVTGEAARLRYADR